MNRMKDELKLIDKARRGDADAFCSLYGLYRERLYRYAFYRLRSEADAEDAVSECVLSAWRQIGTLREAGAFPTWIFRILSCCCNQLIKQQIDRRQQGDAEETVLPVTEHTDTSLILQEALAQLSDEERNVVLLSAVCGLKSREIAKLTGMMPGSVRSSLSRSLKKVRGYLA